MQSSQSILIKLKKKKNQLAEVSDLDHHQKTNRLLVWGQPVHQTPAKFNTFQLLAKSLSFIGL